MQARGRSTFRQLNRLTCVLSDKADVFPFLQARFGAHWDQMVVTLCAVCLKRRTHRGCHTGIPGSHQKRTLSMARSVAALDTYDILAVRPMDDSLYQQACRSLDIDIITFDLG